jgi:methylenetetrahydrofolate dehydrogenase (NADP+)/methenyltetrahydrofolate cyclohydrolase
MLEDIKQYVKDKKEDIKDRVRTAIITPSLLIIQTGDIEASNRYVRNKVKDCEEVGIIADVFKTNNNPYVRSTIASLRDKYHGIIIQLPTTIENPKLFIQPSQDVDGFINPNINPCTPKGIIDYLAYCGYEDFSGKTVLIINRSDIVGKPLAKMFLERNATTIVAHSKTSNLKDLMAAADIIVTAVGKANFITKEMIRENQIVIDVGINFDENGKLCGDCEKGIGPNVTPVPGGVGLLTRVALLENIIELYNKKEGKKI